MLRAAPSNRTPALCMRSPFLRRNPLEDPHIEDAHENQSAGHSRVWRSSDSENLTIAALGHTVKEGAIRIWFFPTSPKIVPHSTLQAAPRDDKSLTKDYSEHGS